MVLRADVIIAVDITSDVGSSKPDSTMETILQSINIMNSKFAFGQCAKADVLIRPKVGHLGSSDFTKRHEAILEGEKAAAEALPKLREIIEKLKQEGRLKLRGKFGIMEPWNDGIIETVER